MRLSIRWKFILSIGLTLLVTYIALLAWDYHWQRETADLQMQDLATTRAHGLATVMNGKQSAAARQADALATAIQSSVQTVNPADFEQALRDARPAGDLYIVNQWGTLVFAYHVTVEPGGFRGGRGPREGRQGRGGPPPGDGPPPEDRPGGREGPPRGGRAGPRRGFLTSIQRVQDQAEMRELSLLMSRSTQPTWSEPRPDSILGLGLLSTYTVPLIVNETVRGAVVAVVDMGELEQYRPAPRGRGRGPATVPTTQLATDSVPASESVVILDEEGHRIWPPEPRRGPPQQAPPRGESVVEQAVKTGREDLANQLRGALAGEAKVVNVKSLSTLLPGTPPEADYWVALSPASTAGWVVAAAIPESQFMNRIVDRLWQRGLFLIAGLLLLMVIVALVSIHLTQPIERMAGAVQQLAAGNLDAQVTGVNTRDELGQLARAFNTMTGQLKQHVAALTEQTAARQSVEAELRIARQIQSDLLPRRFPPFPDRNEFELHAVNVAAKRVAGDFFDFFFAPNGMLTITIADVAGKGMPAALLMAVTRTIIRNLAMEGHSPAQIIERANALLVQDITNSMFVTLFLLQYDTKTGRIVYVNAGHPRPYRFGVDGSPKQFGEVTGAILGVSPIDGEWAFEEREDRLDLNETLLLYTDGVTEARAPDNSMLRDAGLEQLITKYGRESVRTICDKFVEEVNRFQHGQQSDDITLLAIRRVN